MGYVGSVSAASLASTGHRVVGVEIDKLKLRLLKSGRSPVLEPGLDGLIRSGIASGLLRVTDSAHDAVLETDASWICVGTPGDAGGRTDLSALEHVCTEVGKALATKESYHVIVVRSTVPPGTVREKVIPWIEQDSGLRAGEDFGVCMSPEFLREGSALDDFSTPAFTLIGQLNGSSGDLAAESFSGADAPIIRTNLETAEMVKYAGNAFHALKVVFANEIGRLAKAQGIDGRDVMDILCRDTQLNISTAYLKPGFAFGGSCLPKDTRAIRRMARDFDTEVPVLDAVLDSNQRHIERAIEIVQARGSKDIGVLGLSFKAGTDDVRESPVVPLIESLVGRGYDVQVHDEDVRVSTLIGANREFIHREIPHIASLMKPTIDEILDRAQVIVVASDRPAYRDILHKIREDQVLIDLVGLEKGQETTFGGYEGIGW